MATIVCRRFWILTAAGLIALLSAFSHRSHTETIADDKAPFLARKPIPGPIPTPKELAGGAHWQIMTLRPRSAIKCFDLSPDGRLAAFAHDEVVRICDTNGFVLRHVLVGHDGRIRGIAWSPDGGKIATASDDGTARIWTANGTPLAVMRGHHDAVTGIVWSRDGQRLATSSWDSTVRVWSVDGKPGIIIRPSSAAPVNCVAFSPDGLRLVSGDELRMVRIWKIDGTPIAKCEGHYGAIQSLDWSPDGKLVASGCRGFVPEDGQFDTAIASVRIWDANGRFIRSLDGHKGYINSVRFSPDGSKIATHAEEISFRPIRVWTTTDWQLKETVPGDSDVTLRWLPDGTRLYAASAQRIFLVNPAEDQAALGRSPDEALDQRARETGLVMEQPLRFERVLWHPAGTSFAALAMDGRLSLFGTSGRSIWSVNTEMDSKLNKDFSWRPDGKEIVVAGSANVLRMFSSDGKEKHRFSFSGPLFRGVRWSPDGKSILAIGVVRSFLISPAGQQLRTFEGHRNRLESGAWSPDNKRIVTGSVDATLRIWNVGGNDVKVVEPSAGDVSAVDWSPNGRWVAAGLDDGSWRLWKPDGTEGAVHAGSSEPVNSIAFSPDGSRMATGGWEGTVRLWKVDGDAPIANLRGHLAPVMSVAWSPDGKRLLSASRDNTIRLWDTGTRHCELVILKMTDGTTATFSATGDLIEGKPESLDKDLRYLVERPNGTVDLLTWSQFTQIGKGSPAR
jgi:WD40 repeat protein